MVSLYTVPSLANQAEGIIQNVQSQVKCLGQQFVVCRGLLRAQAPFSYAPC
jgi:hypothetical protein